LLENAFFLLGSSRSTGPVVRRTGNLAFEEGLSSRSVRLVVRITENLLLSKGSLVIVVRRTGNLAP
jgi:hypothetical protein